MQYWNYGAALQPCNCPMCSRKITDLTPEESLYCQQDAEVIEVLKKVRKYNHLFVGGTYGLMLVRWTRMLLYHMLDCIDGIILIFQSADWTIFLDVISLCYETCKFGLVSICALSFVVSS